jgi:hypothetical protein
MASSCARVSGCHGGNGRVTSVGLPPIGLAGDRLYYHVCSAERDNRSAKIRSGYFGEVDVSGKQTCRLQNLGRCGGLTYNCAFRVE